jgi:anti-sigma regulatory factor (Ser/Thr protein kinase)
MATAVLVSGERLELGPRDHVVQFYEADDDLIAGVGGYLIAALEAGEVAVVVATETHRRALDRHLQTMGLDVETAWSLGKYVELDAAGTLARFMVDGRPDPQLFDEVLGATLRDLAATGRPVRAFGEMVALLWDGGEVNAAIELEQLWNDLGREVEFSLYCAYPFASMTGDDHASAREHVCQLHSEVLDAPPAGEPREATRLLAASERSPRDARHFVVGTLRRWGHERTVVDDAALVVTELTTNAVIHAQSPFTVTLSSRDGRVRIAVHDQSSSLPTKRAPDAIEPSGRGLRMVETMSDAWGCERVGDGKSVWAELHRD